MSLRKCSKCGLEAITEEDLESFEKDSGSKHGHRNRCNNCSSRKNNGEKKDKEVRCGKCKTRFSIAEASIVFRRTKPTGDKVVGELSKICKACELKDKQKKGVEFIEIDGKFIPVNARESMKGVRITTKELELI